MISSNYFCLIISIIHLQIVIWFQVFLPNIYISHLHWLCKIWVTSCTNLEKSCKFIVYTIVHLVDVRSLKSIAFFFLISNFHIVWSFILYLLTEWLKNSIYASSFSCLNFHSCSLTWFLLSHRHKGTASHVLFLDYQKQKYLNVQRHQRI